MESKRLREERSKMQVGRGRQIPAEWKARAKAWARKAHEAGASWDSLGAEIGVHGKTLREWCTEASGKRLRRVRVVAEDRVERKVSVVSPSGFRIEGLTLEDAAMLLQTISPSS
ncbi:MAG: hypothetical protein ACRELY_00545 [Polyangiaceae bacterium]